MRLAIGICLCWAVTSCGQMARDRFPGHFRYALLNGAHEDLYDRAIPQMTPSAFAEGAPVRAAPRAEVPPLPPAVIAPQPEAFVPPLPPAPGPSPAAPPPVPAADVPPLPEPAPVVHPRAPVSLARWLRHGEPAQMRRQRIAAFAASLVGLRRVVVNGKRYAANCSDFVRAVYAIEGVDLYHWPGRPRGFAGVRSLYGLAKAAGGLHFRKAPESGDLVFFHHTYDFNRNGQIDDFLSHVGVVEKVDGDGTVQFVDRSSGRIRRSQLNLRRAHLWRDPQTLKRLNSHLRGRRRSDPLGTPRLTGELFAGFGTLLR